MRAALLVNLGGFIASALVVTARNWRARKRMALAARRYRIGPPDGAA